ncbi:hypothetical protein ES703_124998 [subsurface metagenome]
MWERLLITILKQIIKSATPDLSKDLVSFLDDLEKKAKATANPFDDLLVMIVRGILDL